MPVMKKVIQKIEETLGILEPIGVKE